MHLTFFLSVNKYLSIFANIKLCYKKKIRLKLFQNGNIFFYYLLKKVRDSIIALMKEYRILIAFQITLYRNVNDKVI